MKKAIPLGKVESETLEFKGRDSRLIDIAREVVAFLNAGGGELWWGVKESAGRAETAEPFEDGEARKRDLQNHLIDTLEPSPRIPDEVGIELVPAGHAGEGGSVIRIHVRKTGLGRAPVAQIKDQGRRYWIRIGDRVRVMSREEIRERFSRSAEDGQVSEKQLLAEREQVLRDAHKRDEALFWIGIQPVPELDDRSFDVEDKILEELLMNPAATGSRANGWNFVRELSWPRIGTRGLRRADTIDEIEIRRTGAIVFSTALERLHWKGGEHEIWPYALLEYPVSLMRLAARVFEKWGAKDLEVLVDFAFVGLQGWTLRGGSPRSPFGRRYHDPEVFQEDDLLPAKPFRFSRSEVVEEPDRCALRLITLIYQAFGYPKDAIPPELDQKTGALTIPS